MNIIRYYLPFESNNDHGLDASSFKFLHVAPNVGILEITLFISGINLKKGGKKNSG